MIIISKYIYGIIAITTSSLSVIYSKDLLSTIPLFLFLFLRQLLGLLPAIRKEPLAGLLNILKSKSKNIKYLFLFVITRIINMSSAYYCISKLDANLFGALELPITLIITILISLFILFEKINTEKLLSLILLLIGLFMIIYIKINTINYIVIALLIINGIAIWLTSFASKKLMEELPTNSILLANGISATTMFGLVSLYTREITYIGEISLKNWIIIGFLSLLVYIANYSITVSVYKLGVTKHTILSSLTPVILIIMSYFILGEVMTLVQFVGVILTIIGVIWYNKY